MGERKGYLIIRNGGSLVTAMFHDRGKEDLRFFGLIDRVRLYGEVIAGKTGRAGLVIEMANAPGCVCLNLLSWAFATILWGQGADSLHWTGVPDHYRNGRVC